MQDCAHIQELLLNKPVENISPDDERDVAAHLKGCPDCRQFQQQIESVADAMQSSPEIHPRDSLRRTLLQHMRAKNKFHKRVPLWRRYLLSRKIAVYQAFAAAALVFFFIVITHKVKDYSDVANQLYMPSVPDVELLNVVTVQQVHQIVDSQKVGVTLSQDTVLSKILFTF